MFICQRTGGICARTVNPLDSHGFVVTPAQFVPPLSVPVVISAPVGIGHKAKNLSPDVTSIQRALDLIHPKDGGALPTLVIDGICGPKTKAAIQKFQLKHFGWKGADGLIEPDKQTLHKLNELLAQVVQQPLTMENLILLWGLPVAIVMGDIGRSFSQARSWILAAQAALISPGGAGLLGKHFLLPQQANPASAFSHISAILDRMQKVFQRPGGLWGSNAFQPEPILAASDNRAWTTAGGFFRMGQSVRAKHTQTGQTVVIRSDTIYVTPIFPLLRTIERSFVIVHELAHFVSQKPEITDHGYYHLGTAQVLPPKERLENADTFAMLTFEAATGSSTSPRLG
jgi:hypothetical protein